MFRAGYGMLVNYIVGSIGAIILGLMSLGVMDYFQQAMIAGVDPSRFGLSGWTQSFVDRGKAAARRAQLEARRDGPLNTYFPEAPAGWTRVGWDRALEQAMFDRPSASTRESDDFADIERKVREAPGMTALMAAGEVVTAGTDMATARRAAVYVKGDSTIVVKAKFIDPSGKSGGFSAMIAAQVAPQFNRSELALAYGGVAFEEISRLDSSWQEQPEGRPRRFKGMIGSELEISVLADAPLSDVRRLLKGIDYAALRSLVDVPENEAVSRQRDLSAELRRKQREDKLREAEERQRIDHELQAMARRAQGSGQSEVCLERKGKRYCAWVDN
ncbi:hypothetical protein [Tropicibacter sp. S64]|uniref:hypothetical protein n=1 Tax=Tropicibacter sp. S64 TaxID=3415122 RepID=UPI003C7DB904